MGQYETKCIITFYGDGWFRRLPITKDAYTTQNKKNFKAYLDDLMHDFNADSYSYEVIK